MTIRSVSAIKGVVPAAFATVVISFGANAQQRPALTADEYGMWEDTWLRGEVNELWITDVGATGFSYSVVERVRPHSPNLEVYEEGRASFLGPRAARSEESGDTFVLRIAANHGHDREITYQDAAYKRPRTTFRAGFDCDKASTVIELAICRNERIAAGDLELNRLYGELMDASAAERRRTLGSDQRAWLTRRNRDCLDGNDADTVCLARLYSDRLVAMARLSDPGLGVGSLFDAAYLRAISARGAELSQDLATRLAMFPYEAECPGGDLRAGPNDAVLFEQTCRGDGVDLWPPITLDFPISGYVYSVMLFVDSDGTVWTATHTGIDMSLDYQELVQLTDTSGHRAGRIWDDAGQGHFFIQSETGFEFELRPWCLDSFTERDHALATVADPPRMPDLVKGWVSRHPVLTDRICCCG